MNKDTEEILKLLLRIKELAKKQNQIDFEDAIDACIIYVSNNYTQDMPTLN